MGLLDRLIGRAVRRLPSRRAAGLLRVDAEGLIVGATGSETRRSWNEIHRVAAINAAQLVGDDAILVVGFDDGTSLAVTEADAAWTPLIEAIPLHLRGAASLTSWRLALIAAPASTVEVYARR